jgi:hypothetical protein
VVKEKALPALTVPDALVAPFAGGHADRRLL